MHQSTEWTDSGNYYTGIIRIFRILAILTQHNLCTLCNIICTYDSGQSNVIIKHNYVLEFFCLDQSRSCHRYKRIEDIEIFLELSLTKLCKMHKNYRKYCVTLNFKIINQKSLIAESLNF